MVGVVTEALRHIKADLAVLLDAPTILALCREVGYQWRVRLLDPVTTVYLCILQILHGHTACSHLPHLSGLRFSADLPAGLDAQSMAFLSTPGMP